MNEEQVRLVGETLSLALTGCFMKGSPEDWSLLNNTAIQIKLPMPEIVIEDLKIFREKLNNSPLGLDFNELLSLYINNLVFLGLRETISKLEGNPDKLSKLRSELLAAAKGR